MNYLNIVNNINWQFIVIIRARADDPNLKGGFNYTLEI